jgi:hypothetical protein
MGRVFENIYRIFISCRVSNNQILKNQWTLLVSNFMSKQNPWLSICPGMFLTIPTYYIEGLIFGIFDPRTS